MSEDRYTLLSINGIDFSNETTLDINVTVRPEQNGTLERDWNGNLVDLTLANFRKYQVSISGSGQIGGAPFGDQWKGSGPYEVRLIPDLLADIGSTDNILTLSMYVDDWTSGRQEWPAETNWQLDLREA